MDRENHKSADDENEFIVSAISKDVRKGWNLILPDDRVKILPDIVLNHMGVATHLGITESGKFEPKNRIRFVISGKIFWRIN